MPPSPSHSAVATRAADPLRTLVDWLRRSETFHEFQHGFEECTGLPLVLRAPGAFQPPLDGSKRQNPFCRALHQNSATCAACLECQARVEAAAAAGPHTVLCHAGLLESAVPVRANGRVIAYLQTGQVRLAAHGAVAPSTSLPALLRDATAELREAYQATPWIESQRYDAELQILSMFAQHLGSLAHEFELRQASAEHPVLTGVKRFIAEHRGDEVTLDQVAAAVNLSPFHFCKVFRRVAGMPFSHYLARERVDAACRELAKPGLRICDAAFAAGFQSLSQFNRTFRRLIGQTPRQYRRRLETGQINGRHGGKPAVRRKADAGGPAVVNGARTLRLRAGD